MFTVALFTTEKINKQPKCPSTDEWIKKLWCVLYTYTHIYIQKNITQPQKGIKSCHL